MFARSNHAAADTARRIDGGHGSGLVADPGTRPLLARRDRQPGARDAMTRVFRTRSRGLVAEFAIHAGA